MKKPVRKSAPKKTISGLKNPDVVELILGISLRKRHVFLENAVLFYMRQREGKRMFDALKKREAPPATPKQ